MPNLCQSPCHLRNFGAGNTTLAFTLTYIYELIIIHLPFLVRFIRLFFRMNQIYRNGSANLDLEDDEEELVWEEEEEFAAKTEDPPEKVAEEALAPTDIAEAGAKTKAGSSQTLQTSSADSSTNTANPTSTKGAQTAPISDNGGNNSVDAQQVAQIISLNEHMKERVQVLESDNQRLLSHEEELLRRIQELEARLAAQDVAQVIPAIPAAVESDHKDTIKATTTPPSKRRITKSAVSGTTSPAPGNDNLATPPASVEPSGKKKGSTAKKLFDSPAPAPSPAPTVVAPVQAEPVVMQPAEKEEAAPVVTIAAASADHASQSSDESAVVVNHTDNPSDDDLHRPTTHIASTASASSASAAVPGKGAFSSQETAKYLAALDDQDDEEEDGWN